MGETTNVTPPNKGGRPRTQPHLDGVVVGAAKRPRGRPKGSKSWHNLTPEEQLARKSLEVPKLRTPKVAKDVMVKCRIPGKAVKGLPLAPDQRVIDIRPSQMRLVVSELCRASFYDFVQHLWHTVIVEPPVWNWHIEYICNELQEAAERVFRGEQCPYDLIINISPGTTKSTIGSVMFRAWVWTRMPHAQMIYSSHNSDLALTLSSLARKVIHSDKYKALFPEVRIARDADNKAHFGNTLGGWSESVGMGCSPVGKHAHFIGVDDPIDPKAAGTDSAKLAEANDFLSNTLPGRKLLGGIAFQFMIQQRLAQFDPTGYMLDKLKDYPEMIKHICIPAEESDDIRPVDLRRFYVDGLMDPVRLPAKVLDGKRVVLGEYGFAGQYQQTPIPKAGNTFKMERFTIVKAPPAEEMNAIVRYWDKAISTQSSGCYTVGVLLGRRVDPFTKLPSYWVLDVVRGRWGADEREDVIRTTAVADGMNYGRRGILIGLEQEPGSAGVRDAEATIKLLAGFRVDSRPASGAKEVRANPLANQFNIGNVHIAPGAWNADFIEEFRYFPFSRYLDQVDATSGAFNLIEEQKRRAHAF